MSSYYKLSLSLVNGPYVDSRRSADDSNANFYYLLNHGEWLHYTESPTNSFYDLPLLIVLFEMLSIGLVIFYFWAGSRFMTPLKNFKLSTERVGIDLNNHFLIESGPAIIRETADAMNKMQQRIQDLINSRTQLLAKISHDLRTPITRLKLRTQFLTSQEQVEKFTQDLDEMDMMITEILSFAHHDVATEKNIKFDLNALLLSVCFDFIDRGHPVQTNCNQGNIPFCGRPIAIKRALVNLIENAIKYAGQADVQIIQTEENISIIIEDNGPGIPEDELEKVFRPYYRSTTTQNINGAGLGLTIVYDVIHSHQGAISLTNRNEHGLQVKIILPLLTQEVLCL